MNEIFFSLFFSFLSPHFLRNRNKWQLLLFEKHNCSLCPFIKSEFIRTQILFTNQKISFRAINCSRYERTCLSYGCYGVPAIILADKSRKQIFRYTDENSALCERLTSFIIEKTNIQPKKKYYLEKFEEIFDNNISTFKDKYYKMLSLQNDLDIADFSYIHQYPDLGILNRIVSTDRCVALALPAYGKTPIYARNIFDFYYKKENFYPIIVKNKIGYQIEESLSSFARIILYTLRGELVIFVNNTLPNIINIIDQFCFIEGYQQRHEFVKMLLYNDTQKAISILKRLLDQNIKVRKDEAKYFLEPDQLTSSFFQSEPTKASSSSQNSSNTKISLESKFALESSYSTLLSEFMLPISNEYKDPIPTDSNSYTKFTDQDYKLPYEFSYLAEEPEALISFAKTMYTTSTIDRITYIIKQLRKTIMYDKINENIKKKLSQRIIILNIIRDMKFVIFNEKYTGNQ